MKLTKDSKGNLVIQANNGDIESIHVQHDEDYTLEDYQEDLYDPYVVMEGGHGNSSRIHLIIAASENDALEMVGDYLMEKEKVAYEDLNLQGVSSIEILNPGK